MGDAENTIQCVLKKLTTEQTDQLAGDGKGQDSAEFKQIAEAVMAWYQMLLASGIVKRDDKAMEVLAGSLVVLGTLVKYAYALGVRRGQRQPIGKRGKR